MYDEITQLRSMMVYQRLEAVPKATTIVFTFTAMTLLLIQFTPLLWFSHLYTITKIERSAVWVSFVFLSLSLSFLLLRAETMPRRAMTDRAHACNGITDMERYNRTSTRKDVCLVHALMHTYVHRIWIAQAHLYQAKSRLSENRENTESEIVENENKLNIV